LNFSEIVFAYMACLLWLLEERSCKIFSKSRRKKNKNAEIVLLLSLNRKSCRNLNFSSILNLELYNYIKTNATPSFIFGPKLFFASSSQPLKKGYMYNIRYVCRGKSSIMVSLSGPRN